MLISAAGAEELAQARGARLAVAIRPVWQMVRARALWHWRAAAAEMRTAAATSPVERARAAAPQPWGASEDGWTFVSGDGAEAGYWWNPSTNEVAWERPAAARPAAAEPSSDGALSDAVVAEAIRVGDAQARRARQLQRAVRGTRVRLGGALLGSVLGAAARLRCASALVRWRLCVCVQGWRTSTSAALRPAAAARAEAATLRGELRAAKEQAEEAAAEAAAAKRRVVITERSRASQRVTATAAASALAAEKEAMEGERAAHSERLVQLEQARADARQHASELALLLAERRELEEQLRAVRHRLREGEAGRHGPIDAAVRAELDEERAERGRVLDQHHRAVRDLRTTRAKAVAACRAASLARCLAHARSKFGRCAQLLRMNAALHRWAAAARPALARAPAPSPPLRRACVAWALQSHHHAQSIGALSSALLRWWGVVHSERGARLRELLREVASLREMVVSTPQVLSSSRPAPAQQRLDHVQVAVAVPVRPAPVQLGAAARARGHPPRSSPAQSPRSQFSDF